MLASLHAAGLRARPLTRLPCPLARRAPPQGPKVLNSLAADSTLDGYNDGLSAAEEVPGGSVEPRLSPALAAKAEFSAEELAAVDGGWLCAVGVAVWRSARMGGRVGGRCPSSMAPSLGPPTGRSPAAPATSPPPSPPLPQAEKGFHEGLGMAGRDLLAEGVSRLGAPGRAQPWAQRPPACWLAPPRGHCFHRHLLTNRRPRALPAIPLQSRTPTASSPSSSTWPAARSEQRNAPVHARCWSSVRQRGQARATCRRPRPATQPPRARFFPARRRAAAVHRRLPAPPPPGPGAHV